MLLCLILCSRFQGSLVLDEDSLSHRCKGDAEFAAIHPFCKKGFEGSTIADARRLARESGADIVILDISTPEGGIEVVKSIFRHLSHGKLLVLTALDDAICVSQAIAAGARGYVLKGVTGQELVAAIKLVYEGRPYVTAELASRLLERA